MMNPAAPSAVVFTLPGQDPTKPPEPSSGIQLMALVVVIGVVVVVAIPFFVICCRRCTVHRRVRNCVEAQKGKLRRVPAEISTPEPMPTTFFTGPMIYDPPAGPPPAKLLNTSSYYTAHFDNGSEVAHSTRVGDDMKKYDPNFDDSKEDDNGLYTVVELSK